MPSSIPLKVLIAHESQKKSEKINQIREKQISDISSIFPILPKRNFGLLQIQEVLQKSSKELSLQHSSFDRQVISIKKKPLNTLCATFRTTFFILDIIAICVRNVQRNQISIISSTESVVLHIEGTTVLIHFFTRAP